MRFHELSEYTVILRSKGVYKQAKVYVYKDGYYAGYGSGFIRLHRNGTSIPNVAIVAHDIPDDKHSFDKQDRMIEQPKWIDTGYNYERDAIISLNPKYKAEA